jgi:hypothetical protein
MADRDERANVSRLPTRAVVRLRVLEAVVNAEQVSELKRLTRCRPSRSAQLWRLPGEESIVRVVDHPLEIIQIETD